MSWGRVNRPSDVLKVGEQIRVKVLKTDPVARKISLGIKQLSPDPWISAGQTFTAGQRVRGKVSRVTEFGAFVELEPGVEGLIHLSEMSWSRKSPKPGEIVKPGETVEVVVLNVNANERRIALGLKQALGDPWEEIEARFPAGKVVEGPVVSLQPFGAFVELADGVEGMIHIGDISREKRLKHPKEVLSPGQAVKAVVLEIDRDKRRLRLGMKQLEPTTADEFMGEHRPGDIVTGRVAELSGGWAKIELGEGITARCRILQQSEAGTPPRAEIRRADLEALTAMLSTKWKQGKSSAAPHAEPVRTGQVRSFKIVSLDPAEKRIELELT